MRDFSVTVRMSMAGRFAALLMLPLLAFAVPARHESHAGLRPTPTAGLVTVEYREGLPFKSSDAAGWGYVSMRMLGNVPTTAFAGGPAVSLAAPVICKFAPVELSKLVRRITLEIA